ncbi:MAG: hypothetical protein DLM58_11765, partial [Pseudonocardiales bacterium]
MSTIVRAPAGAPTNSASAGSRRRERLITAVGSVPASPYSARTARRRSLSLIALYPSVRTVPAPAMTTSARSRSAA